jgi:hypothetical protein
MQRWAIAILLVTGLLAVHGESSADDVFAIRNKQLCNVWLLLQWLQPLQDGAHPKAC